MRRVLLVSNDLALSVHLGAVGIGVFSLERVSASELAEGLPGANLILIDGADPDEMMRVLQHVRGELPGVPALTLGDVGRADLVLSAIRMGAADFLDRDDFGPDLLDRLEMHLRVAATERKDGRMEIVLSVEPGGGAETAFAVNLALLLADGSRDAVLFDCGAAPGECAQALDLKPGYGFAEAARDWDRLDRTLLTSAVSRHKPSGLHLLPLTADAEARPLSPDAVERVVGAARPLFHDAVLTAGSLGDPRLMAALIEAADNFYLLCPQRISALTQGQRMLRRLGLGKPLLARTTLVVDAWRPDILLSEEQMRLALGVERTARLPEARAELINAANAGRPLALSQPKAAYIQALSRLAGLDREAGSAASRVLEKLLARMRAPAPAQPQVQSQSRSEAAA